MEDHQYNLKQIDLAYELTKYVNEDYFEYIYRGYFSENITENILNLNNAKFVNESEISAYKNKISYFLIESLQNVIRHQDTVENNSISSEGLLVIQKTNNSVYLTTANVIRNENIPVLDSYLKKIKNLSPDELKVEYQKILLDGVISEKGGGGLGIITMARRTDGHIHYDFKKINDKFSYYYYQIQLIFSDKKSNENVFELISLDRLSKFHELLNTENILLNFNGSFAFQNLESLLPIIESHSIGGKPTKQKIFDLTVKLIRNIVDFADDFADDADSGKRNSRGVYLLSKKNGKLYLTAGNLILNEKMNVLGNKIKLINNTQKESLTKIRDYLNEFFKFDLTKKPDINLIDMRLKNDCNKIKYVFKTVNKKTSYFILQLVIN
ncbi:MAG: SiaB family protein kinase [Bacteroidales bacterium]|nr:SiaB family protein kinase [Bacteroidales bacterium]